MRDKGVLLSACAQGHNVLKIRPPLVLSAEQAGMVIEALDASLTEAREPVASVGLTVRSGAMSSAIPLDRFDLKILVRLQREGRCSNVDLADSVGLSPSPCLAHQAAAGAGADPRLWRRHRAGKAGRPCRRVFRVTLSSHRPQDFRKFEEAAAQYEEIVECYNVSGGYDYLLKIVAPGVAYFQALMDKMLEDDIGIERSPAGSSCASHPASAHIRSISSRRSWTGAEDHDHRRGGLSPAASLTPAAAIKPAAQKTPAAPISEPAAPDSMGMPTLDALITITRMATASP
jgi:DNA-binding Lrp family transcriptional regulator